jgi:glycosyltransferase A (GT-A) superfamily protein (DUF2064 family)
VTDLARELVLAIGGTAVGWILGYAAAHARAWQRRRLQRFARFHTLRVAPGSRLAEGAIVALNEHGEAVVVTVADPGELERGVITEVFKEPRP